MGLIDQLQEQKSFTPAECAIADYLLTHREQVPEMTIAHLAGEAHTSNPAIIRLCRKLGTEGYREFRIRFAQELEKSRHDQGGPLDYNHPFSERESATSIMHHIAELSQEAIRTCYASVSPADLSTAARWLRESRTIFLLATGDTQISAIAFGNTLMKLGIHCVLANQYDETMAICRSAGRGDTALLISYSGSLLTHYSRELQALRQSGCRTIQISSVEEAAGIDLLLHFPGKESTFGKAGGFYSQSAIRYLLNCLYGMIFFSDLSGNQEKKDRAESDR